MINLISDTITKPTPEMLEFMFKAEVGDDVFQADPSINALQEKAATMFGKAAALFCPSGTMTNQIAINIHTSDLEEMICETTSHVYQSENGGYAYNSRIAVKLLQGNNGKITAEQVEGAINPNYDWLPQSSLVVLENTCNIGGGSIYTLDEIRPISDLCRAKGMAIHLDGARLFNALVETGESTVDYGQVFDTISICLSKGLGAPVGSLLIGSQAKIHKARRLRKVMGGGMRQAGYLAAAGIYALEHHVDRLKLDNQKAKRLGTALAEIPYVSKVRPVESNIVIFDLAPVISSELFLKALNDKGIQAAAFGKNTVRFVTHMGITDEMIDEVIQSLSSI